MKLCECGCGQPAPIATQTHPEKGMVRGQPCRFIKNHRLNGPRSPFWKGGRRPGPGGYVMVYQPNHPRRNRAKYVLEHILIAEKALGRFLPVDAEVHHVNEIRNDNANANLVICQDRAYHKTLHVRMRILAAGGDPRTHKICAQCGLKPRSEFPRYRKSYDGLNQNCRVCSGIRNRAARDKRKLGLYIEQSEG